MSHTAHHRPPARLRRSAYAAAGALVATTLVAAPAGADIDCPDVVDVEVTDAAEYTQALECASQASEGEQSITITAGFEVAATDENVYYGPQPLTIEAAADVVVTGPAASQGASLLAGTFVTTVSEDSIFGELGPILPGPQVPQQEDPQLEDEVAAAASGGDVTIRDVSLDGFDQSGAILGLSTGALTLSGVEVTGSGAEGSLDGPLSLLASAPVSALADLTIEGSTFSGNLGGFGGAVAATGGFLAIESNGDQSVPTVRISDSTFSGNEALLGGGALVIGNATVTGTVFDGNTAGGGGLAIIGEASTVEATTFRHNTAEANEFGEFPGGGGLIVQGGVAVTDSTFVGNSSDEGAGAVYAFSESSGLGATDRAVEISNSTFAGNHSDNGVGGVIVEAEEDAGVLLAHSTFTGNTAGDRDLPASLAIWAPSATVTANAFADEPTLDGGVCDLDTDSPAASSYNFDPTGDCTGAWSGTGDFGDGLDAQLDDLADNGGPTVTALPAAGSPLLDVIPAADLTVDADQRGIARPQGGAGDVGAVEVEVAPEIGDVTFQVSTPGGTIHGVAGPAISAFDIAWVDVADLPTPPAGAALPYGAATFAIEVPAPGAEVTVTLTAPRPFTTAYKVDEDGWSEIAGATYSEDRLSVTYTLTDGGELDHDGTANGVIVDPIALATEATFTG